MPGRRGKPKNEQEFGNFDQFLKGKPKKVGKTGHVYVFQGIESDGRPKNKAGDVNVSVGLVDLSAGGKELVKRGVAKTVRGNSPIWINSLEDKKQILLCVDYIGQQCTIEKSQRPDGSWFFGLVPAQ